MYDVLRYCTLERQLSTISTVPGRPCSNPSILNHGILHVVMIVCVEGCQTVDQNHRDEVRMEVLKT
jgi:hypothetical protein